MPVAVIGEDGFEHAVERVALAVLIFDHMGDEPCVFGHLHGRVARAVHDHVYVESVTGIGLPVQTVEQRRDGGALVAGGDQHGDAPAFLGRKT